MIPTSEIKKLADECYPDAQYGPDPSFPIGTTHEQRMALFRKWKQDDQGLEWKSFTKMVQGSFGMDGAIIVPWSGMYLVIEQDGHTHT